MRPCAVIALLLAACGGKGAQPQGPGADLPSGDATSNDGADDALSREQQLLERLASLEVPGFKRVRGQAQSGFVTLQFDTQSPNAKGSTATVEATVAFCEACPPIGKKDLEARRDQILAQLGELHATSPNLVLSLEDFELAPQRSGATTYVRSFIDDGNTRAAVHTLEALLTHGGATLRFFAYPRNGFPQSSDELAQAFTKAELLSAVKSVFAAVAPVLWTAPD